MVRCGSGRQGTSALVFAALPGHNWQKFIADSDDTHVDFEVLVALVG